MESIIPILPATVLKFHSGMIITAPSYPNDHSRDAHRIRDPETGHMDTSETCKNENVSLASCGGRWTNIIGRVFVEKAFAVLWRTLGIYEYVWPCIVACKQWIPHTFVTCSSFSIQVRLTIKSNDFHLSGIYNRRPHFTKHCASGTMISERRNC